MTAAYLVEGVRTPFGRYGGALAAVRPDDLAAHVLRTLANRLPSVDWAALDDVGDADLVLAGGVESMTRAPFVVPKAESAFSRSTEIRDTTIGWRFVTPKMAEAFGTDSRQRPG